MYGIIPYREYMEQWVKDWVKKQRESGEKGIEIKKQANSYYVYRSTTYWDKKAKKRRKKSTYIGKLSRDGLREKKEKRVTVKQYGNAVLLQEAMKDIVPSLKVFESWEEIYALALVRVMDYVPLKRVKAVWEKLYMKGLSPNLNPKKLSAVLREVGLDREGQNAVFNQLMKGESFVYDLSVVFTRSAINFAEVGYNKDKIHIPQINIALLYSSDGLPAMIKALPGSVRDITSIYNSVKEIDSHVILILDRGFFSMGVVKFLLDKASFVIPARRNSKLYEEEIDVKDHFFYRERLIKCGKTGKEIKGERKKKSYYLYLFEDVTLRAEEEITLYKKHDKGKISKEEIEKGLKRAGKILIISDLDKEPEDIFLMYKQREGVEKAFDVYKNVLNADKMYLQDNESVFGHLFVSFLSLYGYCKLQCMLREKGMLNKVSPMDLMDEYAKVYKVEYGDKELMSEVPKKVRELDEKLELNLFPK
ncbi:MAG: transposase [Thermodesulfobacterium sp.]|nr:transposase [Thermodesulfobacterium sp.]